MRAYTVTASLPAENGDKPFLEYAGTQSDAADVKRKLWEEFRDSTLKRNEIQVDEIEIPTDKKGLIAWLNKHAVPNT